MIEPLVWGTIIIIGSSFSAVMAVLGVYYAITKLDNNKKKKSTNYKLENQKEIK